MPQNSQQTRHWSDQDTQVDTDTPVARHNRLEEVVFVYAAMMFVLLSSLYQVRRASMPRPIDLNPKVGAHYRPLVAEENLPDAN